MTSATSGRALHLTWSTPTGAISPHVAAVSTDPVTTGQSATALTWTYNYSADELTSVPAGNDDGLHSIRICGGLAVPEPGAGRGCALAVAAVRDLGNERRERGTGQRGQRQRHLQQRDLGPSGPLAGGAATAAGFNGTSSLVALPNLGLYNSTDKAISLWFKTTTAPGVLVSAEDGAIAATETKGNFDPVLYVGTDGKLIGLIWSQISPAPVVSAASVADGKWHHVVLSGSYNAQIMWLDGKEVGSTSGAGAIGFAPSTQPWLLGHNYLGTGYLGADYPDEPHLNSATLYATYFNGSIADAAFFGRSLTQGDVTSLYHAGTSPATLLTSITLPSGRAYAAVSYNPLTATVTQVTDANGGVWKLAAPTVSGSSQVYRSAVMGAAPAGYWRLGEPAGATQAADEVNNGLGSYASVTLGAAGPFQDETAASFNGSSSAVQVPAELATASAASADLWFSTTTAGGSCWSRSRLRWPPVPRPRCGPRRYGWVPTGSCMAASGRPVATRSCRPRERSLTAGGTTPY